MSSNLLKALVKEIIEEIASEKKKLYCIDFDNTLVKMDVYIRVIKSDGSVISLTPSDYTNYEKEPDDVFDFSDFRGNKLKNPKEITWVTRILRRVINKRGTGSVVILTARPADGIPQIKTFLRMVKIPSIRIVALDNSEPEAKSNWILNAIKKYDYDEVEFFDDSYKNIQAVKAIADQVPGTKIIARLVRIKTPL